MMPYILPPDKPEFPSPFVTDAEGIVAVGGAVTPPFLKAAYRLGIFPWYDESFPVPLWWSPHERPLFYPGQIKISKSMRQWIRRHPHYGITKDRAFSDVLWYCASVKRKDGEGTWLNPKLRRSLRSLHEEGMAHSIEVWNDRGELVGGLYGVDAGIKGRVFSGESMFSLEPDTSKYALIYLVQHLDEWGYDVADGQVVSPHLLRMGAVPVSREIFLRRYVGL